MDINVSESECVHIFMYVHVYAYGCTPTSLYLGQFMEIVIYQLPGLRELPACPELIAIQSSSPHTHCGDGCMLGKGVPLCSLEPQSVPGSRAPAREKVQIDYTSHNATGVPSRWASFRSPGSRTELAPSGPEDLAITG